MIAAISSVRELAGMVVVTVDPAVAAIAARHSARVMSEGAREGHTGAVMTAARHLAAEGCDLLTLPGDIPLVEPSDVRQLVRVHSASADRRASAFTIVPARDELAPEREHGEGVARVAEGGEEQAPRDRYAASSASSATARSCARRPSRSKASGVMSRLSTPAAR